jgi:hypothetical protein
MPDRLDPTFVRAQIEALARPDLAAYALARFFAKVKLTGRGYKKCWLWDGSVDDKGYGLFKVSPKQAIRAHRFAYTTFCGPLNNDELVCHRCDVPRCVNPRHLFKGSHADNVADCISKNRRRYVRGAAHHDAKLTWPDVIHIRQLAKQGVSQRAIARQHGISQHNVWSIIANKTWRSNGAAP